MYMCLYTYIYIYIYIYCFEISKTFKTKENV